MGMAQSGSTLDMATIDAKHYYGTVPVMSVSMPVCTLLSSREPSCRILTDDRRVKEILAAETLLVALVSISAIMPFTVPPATSTLWALITRLQVDKLIVSPVCGP